MIPPDNKGTEFTLPVWVWFALLSIPVILGLAGQLFGSDDNVPPVAESPVQVEAPLPGRDRLSCPYQNWAGQVFNTDKQNRLRQGRREIRVLSEGDMYTQDYKPRRINIEIDGNNRILRVWCG